MKLNFWIWLLAGTIIFSGCRSSEPVLLPDLPFALSDTYFTKNDQRPAVQSRWWKTFENEELDRLVDKAMGSSFDLKILQARIEQAQAVMEKSQAAFFPFLNYSGGGQKKHTRVKASSSAESVTNGSHSWDAALSGGYTADLWGEKQAAYESDAYAGKAAALDLKQAMLLLSAQVAQTWVDIIAARQRQTLLDNQIDTNNALLKLLKLKFVNGQADALAVSQQQETLAQSEAQKPMIEKQIQLLHNNLSLLCGSPSPEKISISSRNLPRTVFDISVGIPSDVLVNRVDVKAAGMRVFSAQEDWKSVQTDFFPDFTLTAQALFSSGSLDLVFQNWVASLTAALAGPLFDAGKTKAEIKRTRAVMEERLHQYASVVASAVIEIENQLVIVQKQHEYIALLEKELKIARLTLKDARVQYINGSSTYLNYLVTWNGIQKLEQQLIGERATLIKERISLFKALGWPENIAESKEEDNEH